VYDVRLFGITSSAFLLIFWFTASFLPLMDREVIKGVDWELGERCACRC